jgi:hypothetical protein
MTSLEKSGSHSRRSQNDVLLDCLRDSLYKVGRKIILAAGLYGLAKCVGIPTSNEEIQNQVAKEFKFQAMLASVCPQSRLLCGQTLHFLA